MSYECHLTFPVNAERTELEKWGDAFGWKYSAIDADPVLGPGVKQYLTRYFENFESALVAVHAAEKRFAGLLTRSKIELIVYDKRR